MTLTKELKAKLAACRQDTADLVAATNKSSVLVITQFPTDIDDITLVPSVRESLSNVLAFVELGDPKILSYVIEQFDGFYDAILVDSDYKCTNSELLITMSKDLVRQSNLFFYSDESLWAEAAVQYMAAIESGLHQKKIVLCGEGKLSLKIAIGLHEIGAEVLLCEAGPDTAKLIEAIQLVSSGSFPIGVVGKDTDLFEVDAVVGAAVKNVCVSADLVSALNTDCRLFDMGIGTISTGALSIAREKGIPAYRVDNRAGVSGLILSLFETDYLVHKMMGRREIRGIEIVAGGVLGGDGAVVVDSVKDPGYLIGLADGTGRLKPSPQNSVEEEALDFVRRLIEQP